VAKNTRNVAAFNFVAYVYPRTGEILMPEIFLPEQEDKVAYNLTTLIYALYALSLLLGGVPAIVAIVMNYVKKDDMVGTLYESHFRWQIRTFWFTLLWSTLSAPFVLVFGLGMVFLFVVFVWYIYRIAKGWLRLIERKAMY
jgi:uncharacterized membrane protein